MAQPTPLNKANGIMLTVGLVTNNDRWEIVLPIAPEPTTTHTGVTACVDAAAGFFANALAVLLPCFSGATSLVFIQAEGMVDGFIPARQDYAPGAHVGGGGLGAMPTSVAGLILYYGDPGQTLPKKHTRVGKNFMAGIDSAEVTGDHISDHLAGLYQTFALLMMNGFLGQDGLTTYYRVVSKDVPPAGLVLGNSRAVVIRDYVATQRRRLTPH